MAKSAHEGAMQDAARLLFWAMARNTTDPEEADRLRRRANRYAQDAVAAYLAAMRRSGFEMQPVGPDALGDDAPRDSLNMDAHSAGYAPLRVGS